MAEEPSKEGRTKTILAIAGLAIGLLTAIAALVKSFGEVGWVGGKNSQTEVVADAQDSSSRAATPEQPLERSAAASGAAAPNKTPSATSASSSSGSAGTLTAPVSADDAAATGLPATTSSPTAAAPVAAKVASVPDKPGRQPFDIPLPAKRDYRINNNATFTVLAARVTPKTPESDAITVEWRIVARGSQFTRLRLDVAEAGK